jgi:STE24 endopeptidase
MVRRWTLAALVAVLLVVWGHGSVRAQPALQSSAVAGPPLAGQNACGAQAYRLPADLYQRARAYAAAHVGLYFGGVAYELVLLLVVLELGLAPALRNLAERVTRRRLLQAAIFAPLFFVTLSVLDLPRGIAGQAIERRFGQSVQSWTGWLWDWSKALGLGVVLGTAAVWLLYAVLRKYPRRWWLVFWLVAVPVMAALVMLSPVLFEPVFNRFEPLTQRDPVLAAELEQVAAHAGVHIPASRMYVMEASRKVTGLNAYVTGLGVSLRVVIWDTTLQKMSRDEIAFVVGHELGHYHLHHTALGVVFAAAMLLVFLFLGARAFRWTLRRWGVRWGIRSADDWASLPVLLLWLEVFSFLGAPVANGFSRYLEHQADEFGLQVIAGIVPDRRQVAARAFQVLGEADLADPNPHPFVKFWLYSHPPLEERIRFALGCSEQAAGLSGENRRAQSAAE